MPVRIGFTNGGEHRIPETSLVVIFDDDRLLLSNKLGQLLAASLEVA